MSKLNVANFLDQGSAHVYNPKICHFKHH